MSTAIKGIVAKPIIDIVGTVSDLQELDLLKSKLARIGYDYKGEYGIKGRRYSVLYNSEQTKAFCHLHIFKEGTKELHNHIGFRDTLRLNNEAAIKYEAHKKTLNSSRHEYIIAKCKIINEIIIKPRAYYFPRNKAKVLVILGAFLIGSQVDLSFPYSPQNLFSPGAKQIEIESNHLRLVKTQHHL
ncbi:MAG: GrpB family protein [Halobacteriovoraceae bacterium]|nr:GrpB family protein [Halobacteriovoraceae bacterium]